MWKESGQGLPSPKEASRIANFSQNLNDFLL
jgi:hypothetical protein